MHSFATRPLHLSLRQNYCGLFYSHHRTGMKAAKNPPTTLLVYLAAAVKSVYNLQDKNKKVRKNRYFDTNLVARIHLVLSYEEEEQRA